jgi:hypothetical protein
VVTNGSNTRSRSATGIPNPRSDTVTSTVALPGLLRAHRQAAVRGLALHGIAAVHQQIEQHLLQLVAIALDGGQPLSQIALDGDVTSQQVTAQQAQGLFDHMR